MEIFGGAGIGGGIGSGGGGGGNFPQVMTPTTARAFTKIPASIVKAILAVQLQVVKLNKEQFNKFGGFNFTSVDQIYELLGHKMAEQGLAVMPYEIEARTETRETKNGPARYGCFTIGFLYATETDTWTDPSICETVEAKIEGATTYHGIKSLAQKTHLRSVFKVPTGEAELDGTEKPESTDAKAAAEAKKKQKPGTKLADPESARAKGDVINAIGKLFASPPAPEDRDAFLEKWNPTIDSLTPEHKKEAQEAWNKAAKALKAKAA